MDARRQIAVVSDGNWWTRFLRRNPHLELPLFLSLLGVVVLSIYWICYGLPEFSATVSSFQGHQPSHRAAGAPTFAVTLRARNHYVWQHCFKPGVGSAAVAYAGVPLARADLPGFCVPGFSVAKVRFVAAGEGLGMPASLYERLEAQRGRGELVRLEESDEGWVVPNNVGIWSPLMLWCEAMLDGHPPSGKSRCTAFGVSEVE